MNNDICENDFQHILSLKIPWEKLSNKTIVISGANGFIASYIIETLLYFNKHKNGRVRIIGIARNKEKAKERFKKYYNRSDLKLIIQDISDPIHLKTPVHFMIHTASLASPKYYSTDPVGTLKANTLGTYNLLEFAKNNPVENFLFISAGEIYGIQKNNQKTNEHSYGYLDPTDVRSCYAESKRLGETMCVAYAHQYNISTKIVRLYHTYGPGIKFDDGRVFADFIGNILLNQDIVIKSDGMAIRAFCYMADAVAGFFTVLFKGEKNNAYNLANDQAIVSIKSLAQRLVALFPEKKLRVVFDKINKNSVYMQSKIPTNNPDVSKLRSLGWKPYYSIEDGFRRTIQSFSQ